MRFSTSCKKVKVNLSCLENSLETLIFIQISDFNQFMSCVVAEKLFKLLCQYLLCCPLVNIFDDVAIQAEGNCGFFF